MDSKELRKKFDDYFIKNGHKKVESSSLIPQNDPSVLLTTAGMQQFAPNLLGKPHAKGKKLFSTQKCFRTPDIDEIGDDTHHTFFEMLGNWSLGDYFKKEAIDLAYDFFVHELSLDPKRFAITIFKGDKNIERDTEAENYWLEKPGITKKQIFEFGVRDNFWGHTGKTRLCGASSEIHYDRGEKYGENKEPNSDDSNRFVEIWNLVFMEYEKTVDGKYRKLSQKNIDTGVGFERLLSAINNLDSAYETDLFTEIIEKLELLSDKKYTENKVEFRIIADHLRGSSFLLLDNVLPSNKREGSVLRRILRRAILKAKNLGILGEGIREIINVIMKKYEEIYSDFKKIEVKKRIENEINREYEAFLKTLEKGENILHDILAKKPKMLSGGEAFRLFDTYGFPFEITKEIASQKGVSVDQDEFNIEMEAQKERSKSGSKKMFEAEVEDFLDADKTQFLGYKELTEKKDKKKNPSKN
jgi:alanyl-tRNA synthetase